MRQPLNEEFRRMQKLAGIITEVEKDNTEKLPSKEEIEKIKKESFKILQTPEFKEAIKQDIANMSSEYFLKSVQDSKPLISEEEIKINYNTFSNAFDKAFQTNEIRILGMAFGKQNAEEKFEEYTVDGRWKIALGMILAKLVTQGGNIDERFLMYAALVTLGTYIGNIFFKKSPEELKKIKKKLDQEEAEEKKKEEDALKTQQEKEKELQKLAPDFNKTRYGF